MTEHITKFIAFESFQFCNGLIFDKDLQWLNIELKLLPFETFQFFKGLISDKDE